MTASTNPVLIAKKTATEIVAFINEPQNWITVIITPLLFTLLTTRELAVQKDVLSQISLPTLQKHISSKNSLRNNLEIKRVIYLLEWAKLIHTLQIKSNLSRESITEIHKTLMSKSIIAPIEDSSDYRSAYQASLQFLNTIQEILKSAELNENYPQFESQWNQALEHAQSKLALFPEASRVLTHLKLDISESGLAYLVKSFLYTAAHSTNLGFYGTKPLENTPTVTPKHSKPTQSKS